MASVSPLSSLLFCCWCYIKFCIGFLPASAAVVSAILGAGLGYSFYQLGSSLGVATADLLKTNASLYELSSNNPALQQELAAFATSGIDSTTSTYNFSQGLQKDTRKT